MRENCIERFGQCAGYVQIPVSLQEFSSRSSLSCCLHVYRPYEISGLEDGTFYNV